MTSGVELRRQLNTFDVTNLVVGSIIGADIYVAAALGAKLVGPISLLIWFLAGVFALVIALSFSYATTILPKVGGPYSYVKEIGGPYLGFITGWALLIAEWFALAVFPSAFTKYFVSLFPNTLQYEILVKASFIILILSVNLYGVKSAGKINNVLTIAKLSPLILLIAAGLLYILVYPQSSLSNFHPLVKDASKMGEALVLIFWAYVGFELSTLPADEIETPEKTIPRAIVSGLLIVILFYLITNFVILGTVNQETLAASEAPLVVSASNIFGTVSKFAIMGGLFLGFGALLSILGAALSGTIGNSRLAYAMAIDGLLPKIFSNLHPKYRTPHIVLIVLCVSAFFASILGRLTDLIHGSVFLLAFVYFFTCIATLRLIDRYDSGNKRFNKKIPILGIVFSVVLMVQVKVSLILSSMALLLLGIPIYVYFSPKKEMANLKRKFFSRDARLLRAYEQGEELLALPLRRLKWLIYRVRKVKRAWVTKEND